MLWYDSYRCVILIRVKSSLMEKSAFSLSLNPSFISFRDLSSFAIGGPFFLHYLVNVTGIDRALPRARLRETESRCIFPHHEIGDTSPRWRNASSHDESREKETFGDSRRNKKEKSPVRFNGEAVFSHVTFTPKICTKDTTETWLIERSRRARRILRVRQREEGRGCTCNHL